MDMAFVSSDAKKTMCSVCCKTGSGFRDRRRHTVRDLDAGDLRIYLEFEYRRLSCPSCDAVKQRDPGMAGPIGSLYAAVRRPHRGAVPRDDGDAGGRAPSPGLGPGLAHGVELHAPLVGASSPFRASSCHRRRRVLDPQRPPLSAGGGGSGSAKADLARGLWPNRTRSASVL